ncbi:hypothetical protein MASR2M15_18630 [Anaerolineales bacterium]
MSNKKKQSLDLDLILKVQQARMAHDDAAIPSRMDAVYWIEAKDQTGRCAPPTAHLGEWQIKSTLDEVDALWSQIKAATHAGQLSYKAKVSTSPAKHQGQSHERMICVKVADYQDPEQIESIRLALLALGINEANLSFDKD